MAFAIKLWGSEINEKLVIIFGRTEVVKTLAITPSPASALIKKMLELGLIENVRGLGKGKYRFVVRDV